MRLLKYDLKSLFLRCIPLYVFAICSGITNIFLYSIEKLFDRTEHFIIVSSLDFMRSMTVLGITFSLGIVAIYLIIDFYQSIFGREAYLLHTLPITTRSLFHCKIISSNLLLIISSVFVVLLLLLVDSYSNPDSLFHIILFDGEFIDINDFFNFILMPGICGIMMINMQLFQIFVSMALGHRTNHKIVGAVIIYLILTNTASNIPFLVGLATMLPYLANENMPMMDFGFTPIYVAFIFACASLSFVYYQITFRIMSQKLNLE